MSKRRENFLAVYSSVLTLALGAIVLTGAADVGEQKFDTIDVQRINVREPDGTLRMVISNGERFPGGIYRGEEFPHERHNAGMLFFNDEGTENGGLVFAGSRDENGQVDHFVHLSLDRYEQDQVVTLNHAESDGRLRSGLTVSDRPDESLLELLRNLERYNAMPGAERSAAIAKHMEGYAERLFVGRNSAAESVVALGDADNRERLRLKVEPDGQASIEFLDEDGEVIGTITPDTLRQ